MKTTLIILGVGIFAAATVAVVSLSKKIDADPIDPQAEKRWLVRKAAKFPRIAAFLERRLDRAAAGGLFLTISFATVFGLAVFVGATFDMVDEGSGFARLDSMISEYGAANADSSSFDLLRLFTRMGGTRFITLITAVVAAWGWWRYKSFQVALFLITVSVGQALINNGIKWTVARERPNLAQLAPWSGSSFPSGHAAAAAATYAGVALVLTLRSGPRARATAASIAAFVVFGVAATRALLGVHWFTDVIAGVAVGFGWFLIVAIAFGGRIMQFGEPRDEIAVAGSASSATG